MSVFAHFCRLLYGLVAVYATCLASRVETTWRGWPLSATPRLGKKTRNRTRHSPPSLVRSLARTQECVCTRQTGGRNPISRMCAGLTRLSHVRLRDLLIDGCTTSLPLIGRLIVSRFRYLFWLFGFSCPYSGFFPFSSSLSFFLSSVLFYIYVLFHRDFTRSCPCWTMID